MALKLIAGRIYGFGDVRSKLIPFETIEDFEIGEICLRRFGSADPWTRMDEFPKHKFCIELNRDLTEKRADDSDLSVEEFIDHCESKILLHRAELQSIEANLAERLGCLVGDASELAEEIFNFVHNPDKSSQLALIDAYNHTAVERDEDPVEV